MLKAKGVSESGLAHIGSGILIGLVAVTTAMAIADEHITAIGRVAVNHSNLDMSLTLFVFGLISPDWRIGRAVMGEATYQQKLDIARRLVPIVLKSERQRREFQRLFPKLEKAGKDRNAVVHASWGSDEPDEPTFLVAQTNWVRGKNVVEPIVKMVNRSPIDLEALSEEIVDAHNAFLSFYADTGLQKSAAFLAHESSSGTQE